MNTIKTFIFALLFFLFLNNLSTACDFLGVNIGGNKSEIENYFGTIDDLEGMIVDADNTDEEFSEENISNAKKLLGESLIKLKYENSLNWKIYLH